MLFRVKCFASQGEELECDFGAEQRYDAEWLNSSSVKCSGVTVSGDNYLPGISQFAKFD